MTTYRVGDQGESVREIQRMLNLVGAWVEREENGVARYLPLAEDGDFGLRTEAAVATFQQDQSILADGVVGPITYAALEQACAEAQARGPSLHSLAPPKEYRIVRVPAAPWRNGLTGFYLRSDVAARYQVVYDEVASRGGILALSAGLRSLWAQAGPGRSATSFHYTGRALDLAIYGGMQSPVTDPYVIARDAPRKYRVYIRCRDGAGDCREVPNVMTLHQRDGSERVTGHFVDLTALFEAQGFEPIQARPTFEGGGPYMGAEWWHFQDQTGLTPGVSTFGDELCKIYSESELADTPPWRYREHVFGHGWR